MQQVMYANGKLWGALDTALNPDGGAQRAGIAWFIVNPNSQARSSTRATSAPTGYDFTYPAIGVTASGRGVMAFTATGDTPQPERRPTRRSTRTPASAPGTSSPGGAGPAQDDGFTSYKAQVGNPPRTRWGDYGAAAVDGNSIWIASEYIAHACDYTDLGRPVLRGGTGDNLLGTCAGSPARRDPRRARQLVDADQQVHALVHNQADEPRGRQCRPLGIARPNIFLTSAGQTVLMRLVLAVIAAAALAATPDDCRHPRLPSRSPRRTTYPHRNRVRAA